MSPATSTPITAVAAAEAVREGTTSSEQLVTDALDAIAAREDVLRAWAHLDAEVALAEARERDRSSSRGPLHGVPIGVKDIIDVAGMPTSNGSPIHAGHVAERDATAVARLRAAGAVVLGKTVTTEFALFEPGPTTNPHDPSRTPGGSSSGSAAAVAAGMVPLALGTQTAGSVVRPASFCGVVGAKPSFGAIPTDGVTACAPSLDTVGAFGNDVADVALALGVMAGNVAGFSPARSRPRIGFARTHEWDQLEASTRTALEAATERLASGAEVVEVELPPAYAGLVEAQTTVMAVEATRELTWERANHPELLSETLRAFLAEGDAASDRYDDALDLAARCRAELPAVFVEVDVLLAPSVLGEAPPIATTGDPLACRAWTLLGTPTVAVPGLLGPSGLALGLQIVGPPGGDGLTLAGADLATQVLVPPTAGAEEHAL